MRYIEFMRLGWDELVDMSTITHNTLAMGDVEVPRHFIYVHIPRDAAAFVRIHVGERVIGIVEALCGISNDICDTPAFLYVRSLQYITCITTPINK